mmetsp:Transcript_125968/g.350950  ORF Transcript_125968/g.350950 Transcript_125968/m.350950 type:complete len:219 (-) Transcript_125968:59-715(-)
MAEAEAPYRVSEKDTFVHIKPLAELPEGCALRRKSASDPASGSSSRSSSAARSSSSLDSLSAILHGVAAPGNLGEVPHAMCTEQQGEELANIVFHSDSEEGAEETRADQDDTHDTLKGKRYKRPCKGKRKRLKGLIERLERVVEQDPEGFDIDNVELPPSVQARQELKYMVTQRLEKYRQDMLDKRRPQIGAGSSSSSLVPPYELPGMGIRVFMKMSL